MIMLVVICLTMIYVFYDETFSKSDVDDDTYIIGEPIDDDLLDDYTSQPEHSFHLINFETFIVKKI